MITELPEGIIITLGMQMFKEKGYKNWLRNFTQTMMLDDHTYLMHLGSRPKKDVAFVYLAIGGRIRFRAHFVCSHGPSTQQFGYNSEFRKAWIELCGPVKRPAEKILMKGFRGFKYTHKLF